MDEAGNWNNVLVVQPWLTPGSHDKKRVHVRPLAGQGLEEIRDRAWEVTGSDDEHNQAAVKSQNLTTPEKPSTVRGHLPGHCSFGFERSHKAPPSPNAVDIGDYSKGVQGHGSLGDTDDWLKGPDEAGHQEASTSRQVEGVEMNGEIEQGQAETVEATRLPDSVGFLAVCDETSPELVTDNPKSTIDSPTLEPSPLFAHECLTPEHDEVEVYFHDPDHTATTTTATEQEIDVLDDCDLEIFPTDREHILQRIETTKSRLDEDETSTDDFPSPNLSTGNALAGSGVSNASSPQLDSIEEEDPFDKETGPALILSEPTQAGDRVQSMGEAEVSRRRSISSESSMLAACGDSDILHQSSVSEERASPIAAHSSILHQGLAALGLPHKATQTTEERSGQGKDLGFTPDVDGSSETEPTGRITPTSSSAAAVDRRGSVPGSFAETEEAESEEGKDIRTSADQRTSASVYDATKGSEVVDGGLRERRSPGHRAETPIPAIPGNEGRKENYFQAFWRIVFVDWLGAMLARLFGKGRTEG